MHAWSNNNKSIMKEEKRREEKECIKRIMKDLEPSEFELKCNYYQVRNN